MYMYKKGAANTFFEVGVDRFSILRNLYLNFRIITRFTWA